MQQKQTWKEQQAWRNYAGIKNRFKVDNLYVDKLIRRYADKTVPVDLSKLSNVVDNDIFKKNVYDKLVTKVSATDYKIQSTSGLFTKTQSELDKHGLKKKMVNVNNKIPITVWLVEKLIAT